MPLPEKTLTTIVLALLMTFIGAVLVISIIMSYLLMKVSIVKMCDFPLSLAQNKYKRGILLSATTYKDS